MHADAPRPSGTAVAANDLGEFRACNRSFTGLATDAAIAAHPVNEVIALDAVQKGMTPKHRIVVEHVEWRGSIDVGG